MILLIDSFSFPIQPKKIAFIRTEKISEEETKNLIKNQEIICFIKDRPTREKLEKLLEIKLFSSTYSSQIQPDLILHYVSGNFFLSTLTLIDNSCPLCSNEIKENKCRTCGAIF